MSILPSGLSVGTLEPLAPAIAVPTISTQVIVLDEAHRRLRVACGAWAGEERNAASDVQLEHRQRHVSQVGIAVWHTLPTTLTSNLC